jgi:hypothetical protein
MTTTLRTHEPYAEDHPNHCRNIPSVPTACQSLSATLFPWLGEFPQSPPRRPTALGLLLNTGVGLGVVANSSNHQYTAYFFFFVLQLTWQERQRLQV